MRASPLFLVVLLGVGSVHCGASDNSDVYSGNVGGSGNAAGSSGGSGGNTGVGGTGAVDAAGATTVGVGGGAGLGGAGAATGGGVAASGGASDGGGGTGGALSCQPMGSPCGDCLSDQCCAELTDCMNDFSCNCYLSGGTSCGELTPAYAALDQCLQQRCNTECNTFDCQPTGDPCGDCLGASCCGQTNACLQDPVCNCYMNGGGSACGAPTQEVADIQTCIDQSCSAECGGGADPCAECQQTFCADEVQACASNQACTCFFGCRDGGATVQQCNQQCGATNNVPKQNLVQCTLAQCSGSC